MRCRTGCAAGPRRAHQSRTAWTSAEARSVRVRRSPHRRAFIYRCRLDWSATATTIDQLLRRSTVDCRRRATFSNRHPSRPLRLGRSWSAGRRSPRCTRDGGPSRCPRRQTRALSASIRPRLRRFRARHAWRSIQLRSGGGRCARCRHCRRRRCHCPRRRHTRSTRASWCARILRRSLMPAVLSAPASAEASSGRSLFIHRYFALTLDNAFASEQTQAQPRGSGQAQLVDRPGRHAQLIPRLRRLAARCNRRIGIAAHVDGARLLQPSHRAASLVEGAFAARRFVSEAGRLAVAAAHILALSCLVQLRVPCPSASPVIAKRSALAATSTAPAFAVPLFRVRAARQTCGPSQPSCCSPAVRARPEPELV